MIKGGGAALTREKIIASVAEKFICIADASKQVDILGKFPLPVEVIPMARSAVARICDIDFSVASFGGSLSSIITRSTFSTTTIASSTSSPMASTIPNIVSVLME